VTTLIISSTRLHRPKLVAAGKGAWRVGMGEVVTSIAIFVFRMHAKLTPTSLADAQCIKTRVLVVIRVHFSLICLHGLRTTLRYVLVHPLSFF